MKYQITIIATTVVVFACLFFWNKKQTDKAYEQGLMDGSMYTIVFDEMPSYWHRAKMHRLRDKNIQWSYYRREVKPFWDSISVVNKIKLIESFGYKIREMTSSGDTAKIYFGQ